MILKKQLKVVNIYSFHIILFNYISTLTLNVEPYCMVTILLIHIQPWCWIELETYFGVFDLFKITLTRSYLCPLFLCTSLIIHYFSLHPHFVGVNIAGSSQPNLVCTLDLLYILFRLELLTCNTYVLLWAQQSLCDWIFIHVLTSLLILY